jgi:hypothetical protein
MDSFDHIRKAVSQLEPGRSLRVNARFLRACEPPPALSHIMRETAADRILESIIGSAYEYWYEEDLMNKQFIFRRLSHPLTNGCKAYVSPDRRHLYRKGLFFWVPLNSLTPSSTASPEAPLSAP